MLGIGVEALGVLLIRVHLEGVYSMKYIIAQEKNNYGAWQCTLAVSSLIDLGVNQEDIYILLGDYGYNRDWNDFKIRFLKVNTHEYRNHSEKRYIPAVKPYLLYKFFSQFDFLTKEQWCLLDNDVILTGLLTEKAMGTVHVSNCSSYLNLEYLESKGLGLAKGMSEAIGMDYSKIVDNDSGAGGAQYVFDNISGDTWKKAYIYSIKIYDYLLINRDTFPRSEGENVVQYWCSEMWGVLWAIWDDSHKTIIDSDMDFLFATDDVRTIQHQKIIHNAGVTSEDERLFNKGHFHKRSPKNTDLDVDDTKVSYLYYSYLKKILC